VTEILQFASPFTMMRQISWAGKAAEAGVNVAPVTADNLRRLSVRR
jgi:hypothetical protein